MVGRFRPPPPTRMWDPGTDPDLRGEKTFANEFSASVLLGRSRTGDSGYTTFAELFTVRL